MMTLDSFCGLDSTERQYDRIPKTLTSQNYKWQTDLDEIEKLELEIHLDKCLKESGYSVNSYADIKN